MSGGQTVSSVAKTLGLSDQTLHNWLKAEAAGGLREITGKGGQRHAQGGEQDILTRKIQKSRLESGLSRQTPRALLKCNYPDSLADQSCDECAGDSERGRQYENC